MLKNIIHEAGLDILLSEIQSLIASENYKKPKALLEDLVIDFPRDINVLNLLGLVSIKINQYDRALECFNRILAEKPEDPSYFLNSKGVVLRELLRFDEAVESFKKAIVINKKEFYYLINLGNLLYKIRRFEEAIKIYDESIKINSNSYESYAGKALSLSELNYLDDAIKNYDKAVYCNPNYIDAYFNKAVALLKKGDYKEGWKLYEYRWQGVQNREVRKFKQPLWNFNDNKTVGYKIILIYQEQGLGDSIFMFRYLPFLNTLFEKIIIEVDSELKSLVQSIDKDFVVICKGAAIPNFDCQCPMMSLPMAFGTELSTIPSYKANFSLSKNYILKWNDKFKSIKDTFRVGLAWTGSSKHTNNINRSISLDKLEKIFNIQVEFHSLQIDYNESELKIFKKFPYIIHHQKNIHDFCDTAALIMNLDLIISVDTSVAHLSGALGKPTWILLPYSPDFRWMLNREDSPWYSSVRLFRQQKLDNWEDIINKVTDELKIYINANS